MSKAVLPDEIERTLTSIRRRALLLCFATFAAGLAWMSFIPFDLSRTPTVVPGGVRYGLLYINSISVVDIFANLGIYMPLGALAVMTMRAFGWRRFACITAAIAFVTAFSLAIEHSQYLIASRVSSWVDVFCNVVGGSIAATIALAIEPLLTEIHRRFAHTARRNWPLVLGNIAVCLLLAVHLRPYDVVTDLGSAAAQLTHADFGPLSAWDRLPSQCETEVKNRKRTGMFELPRMQAEYLLDRATDFVGYAGLTLLLWIGYVRRDRFSTLHAIGATGLVVLSTGFIVMLIRQFLASHGLDTLHFATAAAGWVGGCAIGIFSTGNTGTTLIAIDAAQSRRNSALGFVAVIASISIVVLYELIPFDFTANAAIGDAVQRGANWLPFKEHHFSRPNDAFADTSGDLLRYAVFAACVLCIFSVNSHRTQRQRFAIAVFGTISFAIAAQGAHVFMPTRRADATDVLLAGLASAAVCLTWKWGLRYRACLSVRQVYDLLTSQLVEGETYDKDALKSLATRRAGASPTASRESARRD